MLRRAETGMVLLQLLERSVRLYNHDVRVVARLRRLVGGREVEGSIRRTSAVDFYF